MPLNQDQSPEARSPPRRQNGLPGRLAVEILEHARRQGLAPGAHLPEQTLAEALRVSRTPVRQALQALEAEGVVENRRNRGFFLKAAQLAPALPASQPSDDREDPLYFRIAEDYLSGRLESRVTESELVRRYGTTRAALQRLMARMTREGLVDRLPGHGWEFQPVLRSPEAYDQGYRFRALIEPAALLEPNYRLAPEVIARLRSEQQAMLAGGWKSFPRSETHRIGAEFHEAIVAAAGNPFLLESIRRVNRMRRLIEYRIHSDRSRLLRTCEDHLRILGMIEAGDREGASHFLRAHLWQELQTKARLTQL